MRHLSPSTNAVTPLKLGANAGHRLISPDFEARGDYDIISLDAQVWGEILVVEADEGLDGDWGRGLLRFICPCSVHKDEIGSSELGGTRFATGESVCMTRAWKTQGVNYSTYYIQPG